MKNYVQSGDVVTIPAPATVASGDVVIVGSLVGIAETDAASGADLAILTKGVVIVPKTAALAINLGAAVYWNTGTALATVTNTDEPLGIAVVAALAAASTVTVKLGL